MKKKDRIFAPKICPECKVLKDVIVTKDIGGWLYQCRDCGEQFRVVFDKPTPLTFQKVEDYKQQ